MAPPPTPAPSVLAGLKQALKPHRAVRGDERGRPRPPRPRARGCATSRPARRSCAGAPSGPRIATSSGRAPSAVNGRAASAVGGRAVGALRRRDVSAGCAARAARRHQRLPRDAGHLLPRVPDRGVRRADRHFGRSSRISARGGSRICSTCRERELQAEYAATLTEQRGFATPLGSLLRQAPIVVRPGHAARRRPGDDGGAPHRLAAGRRCATRSRSASSRGRT